MRLGTGVRLIGLLVIGIGVAGVAAFGQVTTLTCQRESGAQDQSAGAGACAIVQAGLFRSVTRSLPVRDLQGATIESAHDRKGSASYRVVLQTASGPVPVTDFFTGPSPNTQQAAVERITRFVDDRSEATLSLTDDGRFFAYLWGALFVATGALMVVAGDGQDRWFLALTGKRLPPRPPHPPRPQAPHPPAPQVTTVTPTGGVPTTRIPTRTSRTDRDCAPRGPR